MAAASTAILWTADGVLSLVIARAVQGVATGTATSGLAPGLGDGGRHECGPGRRRLGGGADDLAHPRDGGVAGRSRRLPPPRDGNPQDSRRRFLAAVPQ
ncbi:hypothetical protein [Streptomyces sp. NPDC003996]